MIQKVFNRIEKKYLLNKAMAEELIKRIERHISSNMYNNEKAILNKLKELVEDYHTQN
mgnify:CR=1 FL=1